MIQLCHDEGFCLIYVACVLYIKHEFRTLPGHLVSYPFLWQFVFSNQFSFLIFGCYVPFWFQIHIIVDRFLGVISINFFLHWIGDRWLRDRYQYCYMFSRRSSSGNTWFHFQHLWSQKLICPFRFTFLLSLYCIIFYITNSAFAYITETSESNILSNRIVIGVICFIGCLFICIILVYK